MKHVALLAALQTIMEPWNRPDFRYGDAFAGPSGSILRSGGEWRRGVGRLDRSRRVQSSALGTWLRWYLPRPVLLGSRYPGSATIVADVAESSRRRLRMSLWDKSREVVDDLRSTFPKQRIIPDEVSAQAVKAEQLDFLLVDPPGVASPGHPENPTWNELLALMALGQSMLAWLPVSGNKGVSCRAGLQLRDTLTLPGLEALRVCWALGGRPMGCHLVYRCPPSASRAIRDAVREICRIVGWRIEFFTKADDL